MLFMLKRDIGYLEVKKNTVKKRTCGYRVAA